MADSNGQVGELGALDGGVTLPGGYAVHVVPGRLRNQDAIVEHARRLAARIARLRGGRPDEQPLSRLNGVAASFRAGFRL